MRILLYLLLPFTLLATEEIPFTFETAITNEELAWGLMGRQALHPAHGMLFIYPKPRLLSFWMFNCRIDLSLAFFDHKGYIGEIHEMRSYPEKMDPKRPVDTLADMEKYPPWDPIILFFRAKNITSARKYPYALEMEGGWLKYHAVEVGDQIALNLTRKTGKIIKR